MQDLSWNLFRHGQGTDFLPSGPGLLDQFAYFDQMLKCFPGQDLHQGGLSGSWGTDPFSRDLQQADPMNKPHVATTPFYIIRRAVYADAYEIASTVQAACSATAYELKLDAAATPSFFPNHRVASIIEAMDAGMHFHVLETDGRCGGCVALQAIDTDTWHMKYLAVLPGLQRMGLGRQLVRHAVAEVLAKGGGRISLEMLAGRIVWSDWFRRQGFAMTGTRRPVPLPFDLCVMEQVLAGPGN